MDVGPILRFELRRTARHPRSFAIRSAVGFGLLATAWLVKESWSLLAALNQTPANLESPQALRALAGLLFCELTLIQGIAIVCLVPGLVAGSIAEEDRRGTMTDLLASPLSSRAIVLGKLVVQLIGTGVALGVGLPFVLPFALLGILDRSIVSSVYAMLLVWALFVASLSILVAVVIPRPRLATLTAYVLVVGCLLGPLVCAPLAARLPWPLAWFRTLNDWAMLAHPAEAVRTLAIVAIESSVGPSTMAWMRSMLARSLPWFVGFQLTASALFLALSVLLLRPLRLGSWSRAARRPIEQKSSPRPPIGDDPTFWKEWYGTGPLDRPAVRWAFLAFCLLLLSPQLETAGNALLEWRDSWRVALAPERWRTELNESLRHLQETLYLLGFVGVAAIAATSVTGERERGTWTSLATTLVTGREVARAKLIGALGSLRALAIPMLLVWGLGLMTGSVHPLGVVAASAGLAIFLWYAAAVGVCCSMVMKSSERAIEATLLILFVGNVVPLLCVPLSLIRTLTGSWSATYLAGSTPFMTWASLVSPMEIQAWFAGRLMDANFSLPGGIGKSRVELHLGLVRIYGISLALHGFGAMVATWAAARAFDTGRGRR